MEAHELHFCLSTSVSLSTVAIITILRISLGEVFKHFLCSLCAEHLMMLFSAGLKTLSPAADLCMCSGHSQYFWIFGSKVWSDLLQRFFFFQSARCSEILDNAEYPQIPPRQNFYTGKRPWLGNSEHTYISLFWVVFSQGWFYYFVYLSECSVTHHLPTVEEMCCLILSHLFFYLLSVSFPTLIAYLLPAGGRSSAPCSARKIGSLFLIVVVGTAVIQGILKKL